MDWTIVELSEVRVEGKLPGLRIKRRKGIRAGMILYDHISQTMIIRLFTVIWKNSSEKL